MLPYGRQSIDEEDIRAVSEVLRSSFLTTGPKVQEFEDAFAVAVDAQYAVAVNSGTAALHTMVAALGIGPGDEVIVPAITFAASANCVLYEGAVPVFCDVAPDTLLVDAQDVERCITDQTKAVMVMDYGGQPCDYDELRALCAHHGLPLIVDACHSLGATYKGEKVGTLGVMNAFSLHAVKAITTGEGGMISTDDTSLATRMTRFRNHGLDTDHRERSLKNSWLYDMVELGFNYRLADTACALGLSQLGKLRGWISMRNHIATRYSEAFSDLSGVEPLRVGSEVGHAYHLYVVRFDLERLAVGRGGLFKALRAEGIGVNVHYVPVYLHPYYQKVLGIEPGRCPNAEASYERILSLPMFPGMTEGGIDDVVMAVTKVMDAYRC